MGICRGAAGDVELGQCGYAPINVDLSTKSQFAHLRAAGEESQDGPSLNNSQVLVLRDLSQPERMFERPFEARVESPSVPSAKMRSAAFWAAMRSAGLPVRVGRRSKRLAAAQGNEGATGISIPSAICGRRAMCRLSVQRPRFVGVPREPPVSGPFMAQ